MQISTVSNTLLATSLTQKQQLELSTPLSKDGQPLAATPETTRAVNGVQEQKAQNGTKSNQDKAVNPNDLAEAIKQLNETVKLYKGDLHFMVDGDTHLQVVKVVDKGTKEVIRQIPSPEVLRIAKAIDDFSSLLLKDQA